MQYQDDTALDKKTFTAMMKRYVKQVRMHLKDTNPEREEKFVAEMNDFVKKVLKDFKDFDYYHGTVDYDAMEEKIDEMLKAKKELADLAVYEGEKIITELSDEEIYEIFTLSA